MSGQNKRQKEVREELREDGEMEDRMSGEGGRKERDKEDKRKGDQRRRKERGQRQEKQINQKTNR